MWPITKHRPKMFLPIGESTVIDRIFAELEADDRIDEVYVSTNQRFAPDFEAHLADSEFDKPRLSVEETTEEDESSASSGRSRATDRPRERRRRSPGHRRRQPDQLRGF